VPVQKNQNKTAKIRRLAAAPGRKEKENLSMKAVTQAQ
jgi:hypothetical protein